MRGKLLVKEASVPTEELGKRKGCYVLYVTATAREWKSLRANSLQRLIDLPMVSVSSKINGRNSYWAAKKGGKGDCIGGSSDLDDSLVC